MKNTIRAAFLAGVCLAVTPFVLDGPAFASQKAASTPPFALETFFAGKTEARGKFESGIAGVERAFTVKTNGRWNGKLLVLVEDIFYDDGQKERKIWRITKTGAGQYIGERDDVIGTAQISQQGETITLDYSADVSGKDGSTTRVRFADTIVPAGPNAARNTATVYKYILPIGSVDITFRKLRL